MSQLTIQIPDILLRKLRKQADINDIPVDEWIIDTLETIAEPVTLSEYEQIDTELLSAEERMEKFLRESGLFATQENNIGPELEKLARPISAERRRELAKKASVGKPLSEIIIESRGI